MHIIIIIERVSGGRGVPPSALQAPLDGRLTCLLTLAKGETEALAHMHFYPRNSPTTPTMDAATPPTSIHIALSVGEPVKKRAMSELNDLAALTPKMSSRIPPASSASATALCMFCLSCCQRPAQRGLSAAGKRASKADDTGSVLRTL